MTRSRVTLSMLLLASMLLGLIGGSAAAEDGSELPPPDEYWQGLFGGDNRMSAAALPTSILTPTLLAKAQPDECFAGIGVDYPDGPPCPPGSEPKVNQAYVWGLTQAAGNLWFGTAPNVHCLVIGGYLGQTAPFTTDSYTCEFGASEPARDYGLPAAVGDWRPPKLYSYDLATGQLVDRTPDDPRFAATLGLRSAGAVGDIVFVAGPAMSEEGGINLFAFQASSKRYLGGVTLTQYDNIRKWLVHNGVLYTAVHNRTGGGSVLRWTGTTFRLGDRPNSSNDRIFRFDVVGSIDADGAELVVHDGRLVVSTWPDFATGALAGLWMSPRIPSGGLTTGSANYWTKIWSVDQYEPDPVVARTYGGGALASYGGQLYWGTMHVPFVSALAHLQAYGPSDSPVEALARVAFTHRAISIFRGRPAEGTIRDGQVLYGMPAFPVYDPADETWSLEPNGMGEPVYGPSGFGNPLNNYTWTMGVYGGRLYVGTMDFGYLLSDLVYTIAPTMPGLPTDPLLGVPLLQPGADLWRFDSGSGPAVPESLDGVGNPTSYGIRTMLPTSSGLYLGMANPMNLLTDPGWYQGGWELLRLR